MGEEDAAQEVQPRPLGAWTSEPVPGVRTTLPRTSSRRSSYTSTQINVVVVRASQKVPPVSRLKTVLSQRTGLESHPTTSDHSQLLRSMRTRVCWAMVFAVHLTCFVANATLASFYGFAQHNSAIAKMAAYESSHYPACDLLMIGVLVVFACGHACLIVKMINTSVWKQRLAFAHARISMCHQCRWSSPLWTVLRKSIEIACQILQIYRMHALLPRVALNRLYVLTITLNCFGAPLVQHWSRSSPSTQHLLRTCFDTFQTFTSSVVLELALWLPYSSVLLLPSQRQPTLDWYDSKWCARVAAELRVVLTASWWDVLVRGYFVFCLFLDMVDLQTRFGEYFQPAHQVSASPSKLRPIPFKHRSTCAKLVDVVFLVAGIAVLALHIRVTQIPTTEVCALQVFPWERSGLSCVYLDMDCTNPKIKDVDAMATQLKDISWSSALVIAFRNCKALRVPVAIQQLQSLVGIHVTNSSIAQWDAAAALTAERHPSLRFVYVVDTNIGSIPLGMLAPNAPPTLTHVLFRRCRLSTLPLTAADVWPPGMALGLEDVGLSSTLPPVLERMRLSQLSLANNNIARVPASVFNRSELVVLVLDGNPLTELPSDAVVSTSLRSVSIRNTSISTFPVQMQAPIHIWASSTPLCSASGANATASTSIDCAPWPLYHPLTSP